MDLEQLTFVIAHSKQYDLTPDLEALVDDVGFWAAFREVATPAELTRDQARMLAGLGIEWHVE